VSGNQVILGKLFLVDWIVPKLLFARHRATYADSFFRDKAAFIRQNAPSCILAGMSRGSRMPALTPRTKPPQLKRFF